MIEKKELIKEKEICIDTDDFYSNQKYMDISKIIKPGSQREKEYISYLKNKYESIIKEKTKHQK